MPSTEPSPHDDLRDMRVVARYGHRLRIAAPDAGDAGAVQARTLGKRLRPVTGDIVAARPLPGETDWIIESIAPRDNELARPDSRGRREILAANIDLMVVVTAAAPPTDWYITDRYLAAARLMPCDAAVVWNKSDLAPPPGEATVYRDIGYPLLETSAARGDGTDALADLVRHRITILVGQSGVGKSSLINALTGRDGQRTGAISDSSGEGRHTTVTAELIRTGSGIAVIDSPGVRDYAPSIDDPRDVDHGYAEIADAARSCRFADCQHRAEPGCAVKAAVAEGRIDARRYESYRRLRQLTVQLGPRKRR